MPKKIGTELILPEVSPSSTKKLTTPILHQLHGVSQDTNQVFLICAPCFAGGAA